MRQQKHWEAQLREKGFLIGTIKPIVEEAVASKAPVPCALREVKRAMDKGVHFRDNTYGVAEQRETRIRRLYTSMMTGLSGLRFLLETSLNEMRGF